MYIKNKNRGLTFIEVMATVAIISILAAGILPLSRMMYKRKNELKLRRNLRIIRTALDQYKKSVDMGNIQRDTESGYPKTLAVLVRGADINGIVNQKKKFLRKLPRDPMTKDGRWGLKSYADEPDSTIWGGQDVYDVYSKSNARAIDGTFYGEW